MPHDSEKEAYFQRYFQQQQQQQQHQQQRQQQQQHPPTSQQNGLRPEHQMHPQQQKVHLHRQPQQSRQHPQHENAHHQQPQLQQQQQQPWHVGQLEPSGLNTSQRMAAVAWHSAAAAAAAEPWNSEDPWVSPPSSAALGPCCLSEMVEFLERRVEVQGAKMRQLR
ncbi:unnamed protein product, partial [Polarella glacialis]